MRLLANLLVAAHLILSLTVACDTCRAQNNERYAASRHRGNLTNAAIEYIQRRNAGHIPHFHNGGTVLPVGSFVQSANPASQSIRDKRAAVKEAVKHAWDGYVTSAWGFDELLPVTKQGKDTFSPNLGTTIVDSLSTLYIMGGLDGRYERARTWVAEKLNFENVGCVIVFETVIRILGGLLSMYHLSGDTMYLSKAEELGARLAVSFETPKGLPWPKCYLNETGRCESHVSTGDSLYLAEVGTVQLEYRALAHHSKDPLIHKLRDISEEIIKQLQVAESSMARLREPHGGLLPYAISMKTGRYSTNMVTMGAPADSYFEYLVKVWIQGGRREKIYWDLFAQAMDSMIEVGLYTSSHGDTIVREVLAQGDGKLRYNDKMDHFSCYIPGMIVLGLDGLGREDTERRKRWERVAEELTETCYKMYSKSPSGLAGEHIRLGMKDEWKMSGGYQLRPEALEAFFYMWRHSKKEKYREYAWKVFKQIEKVCRVEGGGYSAIRKAKSRNPRAENVMHSFLISETFKYVYLIFGEDDELGLERWVFNTEAHPLLVMPGLETRQVDKQEEREEL